jgi:hypothetical protein
LNPNGILRQIAFKFSGKNKNNGLHASVARGPFFPQRRLPTGFILL